MDLPFLFTGSVVLEKAEEWRRRPEPWITGYDGRFSLLLKKKKMVYLHVNEGRTIASLSAEYEFAKSTYREWKKILRRMSILPNSYYSCRKNRKSEYRTKLAAKLEKVGKKFHDLDGTRGYRQVCDQLKKDGLTTSHPTCHKYLNKLLGLKFIQRKRKPVYGQGDYHQVLENILNQDFKSDRKNEKWCMDFTYAALKDGNSY